MSSEALVRAADAADAYRVRRAHRHAFLIDEKRLRHLSEILSAHPVMYRVWLSDGTVALYSDIDRLVRLRNSADAQVLEISVEAKLTDDDPIDAVGGKLRLSDAPEITFEFFCIHEQPLRELIRRLDDWARELRVWYSPAAGADRTPLSLVGYCVLIVAPFYAYTASGVYSGWRFAGTAFLAALVPLGLVPLFNYIFPNAVFAIGYGTDREVRRERVRQTFFASVVVALVIRIAYDLVRHL